MQRSFAESHVEGAALAWLAELGYAITSGPEIAPDSKSPRSGPATATPPSARLARAADRLNSGPARRSPRRRTAARRAG